MLENGNSVIEKKYLRVVTISNLPVCNFFTKTFLSTFRLQFVSEHPCEAAAYLLCAQLQGDAARSRPGPAKSCQVPPSSSALAPAASGQSRRGWAAPTGCARGAAQRPTRRQAALSFVKKFPRFKSRENLWTSGADHSGNSHGASLFLFFFFLGVRCLNRPS